MRVSGQLHTTAALSQWKEHQRPQDRRMGGPRAGLYAVA